MDRRTLIRTGGLGLIGLGFEACSRAAGPSVLSPPLRDDQVNNKRVCEYNLNDELAFETQAYESDRSTLIRIYKANIHTRERSPFRADVPPSGEPLPMLDPEPSAVQEVGAF